MKKNKVDMSTHRWSGWPGAWCLDCGQEDPFELELAGMSIEDLKPLYRICPCPGEGHYDPYKIHDNNSYGD